jgi:spore coat polysaccharide biosynthesis protein SpsF
LKVIAIIQARMNSTRLPGKVIKQVLGKSLLEYQVERVRRAKLISEIVIATTTNDGDEPILDICRDLSLAYYRGSEHDVLARYYGAATAFKADAIVRLTSDCPLIDPDTIDRVVGYYWKHQLLFDYVSNILKRSYPRGMDTEVFSAKTLRLAYREANTLHDREHVTPFIYNHSGRFRLGSVQYSSDLSHQRLTVDTAEDLQLITNILQALYPTNPHFTLADILDLLDKRPDWCEINALVSQKK